MDNKTLSRIKIIATFLFFLITNGALVAIFLPMLWINLHVVAFGFSWITAGLEILFLLLTSDGYLFLTNTKRPPMSEMMKRGITLAIITMTFIGVYVCAFAAIIFLHPNLWDEKPIFVISLVSVIAGLSIIFVSFTNAGNRWIRNTRSYKS